MTTNGVQVNDLWAFAKPRIAEIKEPGSPHLIAKGSQAMATQIVDMIRAALAALQDIK